MMANALVICASKTGTLTHKMVIFTGSVSLHTKFTQKLDNNWIRAGDEEKNSLDSRHFAIDMSNLDVTLTLLR